MSQKPSTVQKDVPHTTARASRSPAPAADTVTSGRPASSTPAGSSGSTPARSAPPTPKFVAHEAIAKRAFAKWQENGCPEGTQERDWFEAERELSAE